PTEHFLGLSSGRFPSVFLCFVSVLRFRLYQTLSAVFRFQNSDGLWIGLLPFGFASRLFTTLAESSSDS
ncbi:hypothetical protein ACFY7Z_10960, partial [Streptomyces sp. NPDC012623]|uniref:hypothetical protein n=1 Tax=unclassified Streptomyces TaxID=2593676 RepID=UPI003688887A